MSTLWRNTIFNDTVGERRQIPWSDQAEIFYHDFNVWAIILRKIVLVLMNYQIMNYIYYLCYLLLYSRGLGLYEYSKILYEL